MVVLLIYLFVTFRFLIQIKDNSFLHCDCERTVSSKLSCVRLSTFGEQNDILTHIFNVCSRLHIIAIIAVQLCSSYKGPHFHLVVRNTSILHTNSVIQIRFPRWYYTSTPWCFTRVLLENDSRVLLHGFYRKKAVRLGSDFVGSMATILL